METKKGNPFVNSVAYSLSNGGYAVSKPDLESVDLLVYTPYDDVPYVLVVECKKHKSFTWNKLIRIFNEVKEKTMKDFKGGVPALIFKTDNQPVLVMMDSPKGVYVAEFRTIFNCDFTDKQL